MGLRGQTVDKYGHLDPLHLDRFISLPFGADKPAPASNSQHPTDHRPTMSLDTSDHGKWHLVTSPPTSQIL